MTLKALLEKRAGVVAQIEALVAKANAEDRDLTEAEQATYDGLKKEADALQARITRAQEVATLGSSLEDDGANGARAPPGDDRGAAATRVVTTASHGKKSFSSLGEFFSTVAYRPNDSRLASLWKNKAAIEDGDHSMGDGPSGGFMVPTELRQELLKVDPQGSQIRSKARVIPAGSPPDAKIEFPALDQSGNTPQNSFGGVQLAWIGEGAPKPKTGFKLKKIALEPQELAGTMRVTDKLLRNWAAAGAIIGELFRGALAQAEDDSFLNGDGVAKPLGIINAGASMIIQRETAGQITYTDLVNMLARMLMRGGTPRWMASQSIIPQLLKLRDPEGHYIFQPNAREGMPTQLLGYPIDWNENSPLLGTKGDIVLANWQYYLVKDGSGPFVASSEHVLFEDNMTVFKIFTNVDGQPWLQAPFKQKGGYEVSPFALLGNAG